jgi:hypothetical protein
MDMCAALSQLYTFDKPNLQGGDTEELKTYSMEQSLCIQYLQVEASRTTYLTAMVELAR